VSKAVEAIFEQGVFKPVTPLSLPEHKKVMLYIEEEHEETQDIFSLSSEVYNDLSPEDINDVEDIALDRNYFSRN
jgi:predicted DNA-binding antitoxin AbrB/MazE fold protein